MKKFVTCIFVVLSLHMSICLRQINSNSPTAASLGGMSNSAVPSGVPTANNPTGMQMTVPKKLKSDPLPPTGSSATDSSKNIVVPSKPNNDVIPPKSNNQQCKDYKEAVELKSDLEEDVKRLDKLMDAHANSTLASIKDTLDINNTYSKFPVENITSYKSHLKDLYVSYESGFYDKAINRLYASIDTKKFPADMNEICKKKTDPSNHNEGKGHSEGLSEEEEVYFNIVGASGKCLSAKKGEPVTQKNCSEDDNVLWRLKKCSDKFLIVNKLGRYLNSKFGDMTKNIANKNGHKPSKIWQLESLGEKTYMIKNKLSGNCILENSVQEGSSSCSYKITKCIGEEKKQEFFFNEVSNNPAAIFAQIQNKNKVNLSGMQIMTVRELHKAYTILLQKSKKLLA